MHHFEFLSIFLFQLVLSASWVRIVIIWIICQNSLETKNYFVWTPSFPAFPHNVFCASLLTRAGSKILSTPKRIRVIMTKTIKVVDAGDFSQFSSPECSHRKEIMILSWEGVKKLIVLLMEEQL